MPEVLGANEIYLASRSRVDGSLRSEARFKLVENTSVIETLEGLNPPTISIGEQGRDTQPQASTVTITDVTDGLGVRWNRQDVSDKRFYFSTLDTRYRRQIANLPKKTNRGVPSGVTALTSLPGAGGVHNNRVYVAWGSTLRSYTETAGWSTGTVTGPIWDRTFPAVPTGDPVHFADGWFWPMGSGGIDYLNPTGWDHVAINAVGLLALVDTLYAVTADGVVSMITLATADSAIAGGTLDAAGWTNVVRIDDDCSGLVAYTTTGTGSDIVPYVVGKRRLYEINVTDSTAMAGGPAQLPPNIWPMNVSPLATSNALYIAQGMGMLEWNNSIVVPKGLDNDDGVPQEFVGGIMKLVPGFENLFAIVFGTRKAAATVLDIYGSGGDLDDGVMMGGVGTTWLATYEGEGWHTRAVRESLQSETNVCCFLSDAENTYRVWFALGEILYSIDLEVNVFNPLDNPDTLYETRGYFQSSHYDYTFLLEQKIGLMVQLEVVGSAPDCRVSALLVLDDGGMQPLYDRNGTAIITEDGIYTFLIHADQIGPDYTDQPAVGKPFSTVAVRLEIEGTEDNSPAVRTLAIHAIKANVPVRGWQVTLDLAQPHHDNLSAWQQRQLLLQMLQDATHGLLHFGYLPDPEAAAGTALLYPVMPTVVAFSSPTGTAYGHQTRVRLAFVEGYRLVPDDR